jgi:molecular chaperone GrpE (heat shock protein)
MPHVPFPDALPETSDVSRTEGASELALDLYRQLAQARRETHACIERAGQRIEAHVLATSATIAALATERFELDRLIKRIEPELAALGADNALRVLDLFARAWSASLARHGVEVRDLTGASFDDEIAEAVEVNAAIEDASIATPMIRETLAPLVVHRGRIVGKAVVNKGVPSTPTEPAS